MLGGYKIWNSFELGKTAIIKCQRCVFFKTGNVGVCVDYADEHLAHLSNLNNISARPAPTFRFECTAK